MMLIAKSTSESPNNTFVFKRGEQVIEEFPMRDFCKKTDGIHDEGEVVHRICQMGIDYAIAKGYKAVVLDALSFADAATNISYIINTAVEYVSEACNEQFGDLSFIFLIPLIDEHDTINALDETLNKPIKVLTPHSYGDYGDPLSEQFQEFQRTLEQEKTFRDYLVDLMAQKGIKKSTDVYKPSGISKYTFSKLLNFSINPPHKPSKETVAALTIGLKLKIEEAEEFYHVAGYSLGKTEFIDQVIRFFIYKKIYNIDEVNYCLAYHGYPLLGEKMRGEGIKIIIK